MPTTNEAIHLSIRLQNFYGGWALYLPDAVFDTSQRALVYGTLNMHNFEGIAEPWRDQQHVLVIPQPIFRELWINENQVLDLVFRFKLHIPRPEFPAGLKRTLHENPDYSQAFAGMTESDQRQYEYWIASAPSKGVQEHRIEATIAHLRELLRLPVKPSGMTLPHHSPDIIPDNFK